MENRFFKSIRKYFNDGKMDKNKNLFSSFASTNRNFAFSANNDNIAYGDVTEYKKFLNDPHVSACVQSRKSGVLSMNYEVISDDDVSEIKEFIDYCFNNIDVSKVIDSILNAPYFGYVPIEVYYKIEDNKIIPTDLIEKPSEWFSYDKHGVLRFKNGVGEGTVAPAYKMLVASNDADYTNPYGVSVLKKCYHSIKYKEGAMILWLEYIEKYGMPYLYAKTDIPDVRQLIENLSELRRSASIVIPKEIDLGTLSGDNSSSSDNFIKLITYCNTEISKAILSQTLTTEQSDTGSYAMAKTHLDVRKDVVIADSKIVEGVFNKLIKWLVDLNFETVQNYPKFILYSDLDVDRELAERDRIIFEKHCKPTKDYLMKAYGFSRDDIEMVEAVAPAFAENEEHTHNHNSEADLTIFDDFTRSVIVAVIDLIEAGKDFKEIQTEIIELFPKLDSSDMENYLAKALVIAQAQGIIKDEH